MTAKKALSHATKSGKGIMEGLIGIDLTMFDLNHDGKVTWEEIKSAGIDAWFKFIVSVGTTILAIKSLI